MWRGMERKFEIQHNSRFFWQGCVLTLLGLAGPFLVRPNALDLYQTLADAMLQENSGLLLIAATKLVCMNVLRMVPHYLGAFLLNESLHLYINGRRRFAFNVVVSFSVILLIYEAIFYIYGIRYDFGIPAILTISFVLLLSYMNLFSVSIVNKTILVASLLLSIQWLDVNPYLTEKGFGRGEISMDVKNAAELINDELLLAFFATIMCLAFLYAAIIQTQLLSKEHTLRVTSEKAMEMERELHNTQVEALKMRNYSEVQTLVHDLKSPLTTIQGLISLAEMMEQTPMIKEYFQKISSALTSMSMMISEILYENARTRFDTAELMRMVLAQISIIIPKERLSYTNTCPDACLLGNKIRLSRAIINLLSNAWKAVDQEKGRLEVEVQNQGGFIYIIILDDGVGISREEMEHIWEAGYSGSESTGLGLTFVKQVVENHGGNIWIQSEKGKYTRAVICLKRENDEGRNGDGE